ncbi:hypothetical protein FRC03_007201 [Tulasnella sp. 419]|nr:hypothetical protein FRC03_007201 [Tulasnella sp. 419]
MMKSGPSINTALSPSSSKPALVPTNTVSTKDGQTVRARIDPTLPVADVVRQLCQNLKVPDHPALYALRDEQDELITDENLRKKIKEKVNLKLVSSPVLEAVDIVEKLGGKWDDKNLKLALYSLQKYIQEEQFANEFLKRNGLAELLRVITFSHGNTLAYALKALQNLTSLDHGWTGIPTQFISKLIQIISNPHNLVNVSRPATAILKRLVEADPRLAPTATSNNQGNSNKDGNPFANTSGSGMPGSSGVNQGGVWNYGFDVVYDEMIKDGHESLEWGEKKQGIRVLETVVQRLSSGDANMAIDSMMLINALLKNASDRHWENLGFELERLNVRKAVVRLMASNTTEDLTSSILEFQANCISLAYRRKTTPIDTDSPYVRSALDLIWKSARLNPQGLQKSNKGRRQGHNWDDVDLNHYTGEENHAVNNDQDEYKDWEQLGFESDNMRVEFSRVGLLGLDCLKTLCLYDQEWFAETVLDQLSRPVERRCLVGKASNEVVELLSEHWAIYAPGYSTSSSFQPYFLTFYRIHAYTVKFFLRMWNESGAVASDFPRVAALVQSQIRVVLNDESRPWHEVERDLLNSEYREVRERQMRELELQDDLVRKPPVRNLRAKLYKDSFEFVRSQRILCLMQGAWFVNGLSIPNPGSGSIRESISIKRSPRPWRFFRLDKSMRYLHYIESAVKIPIRGGLEDLPERIDVSLLSEVVTNTCALPHNILPNGTTPSDVPPYSPGSPLVASPLSFSLMSTRGGSLADLVAENSTCFSDWIDGFNMLLGDHFTTKETAEFVQALTEIGLKIKLLDLSGERVEIPDSLPLPPLPLNTDFFFSDFE